MKFLEGYLILWYSKSRLEKILIPRGGTDLSYHVVVLFSGYEHVELNNIRKTCLCYVRASFELYMLMCFKCLLQQYIRIQTSTDAIASNLYSCVAHGRGKENSESDYILQYSATTWHDFKKFLRPTKNEHALQLQELKFARYLSKPARFFVFFQTSRRVKF